MSGSSKIYTLFYTFQPDFGGQFPIVRADDEKACGRYRTRDLVLAYLNAVAAGDLTTIVNA